MSKTQFGWLLFAVGLAMITVLLVGDIITLIEAHGKMDFAFVRGMLMHYSSVVSAFAGGKFLKQYGSDDAQISDQKRAELNERVGV